MYPLGQLREILGDVQLIFGGQDHFADACTLGAEYLLLDATVGQTKPESEISPASDPRTKGPPAEEADQGRDHGDSRRRTILGDRARGHVDVNILLAE